MRNLFLLIIFAGLLGCVSQSVSKVNGISKGEEICVVRNHSVSQDFYDAYTNTLRKVGLSPKQVETPDGCELHTTYTAQFGVHWGLYLARAKLDIYKGGSSIGSATYKAPRADPSKHGKVETKVQKLVDEIFADARSKT